jgi:hypothetical protein
VPPNTRRHVVPLVQDLKGGGRTSRRRRKAVDTLNVGKLLLGSRSRRRWILAFGFSLVVCLGALLFAGREAYGKPTSVGGNPSAPTSGASGGSGSADKGGSGSEQANKPVDSAPPAGQAKKPVDSAPPAGQAKKPVDSAPPAGQANKPVLTEAVPATELGSKEASVLAVDPAFATTRMDAPTSSLPKFLPPIHSPAAPPSHGPYTLPGEEHAAPTTTADLAESSYHRLFDRPLIGWLQESLNSVAAVGKGASSDVMSLSPPFKRFPTDAPLGGSTFGRSSGTGIGLEFLAVLALPLILSRSGGTLVCPCKVFRLVSSPRLVTELPG